MKKPEDPKTESEIVDIVKDFLESIPEKIDILSLPITLMSILINKIDPVDMETKIRAKITLENVLKSTKKLTETCEGALKEFNKSK